MGNSNQMCVIIIRGKQNSKMMLSHFLNVIFLCHPPISPNVPTFLSQFTSFKMAQFLRNHLCQNHNAFLD